MSIRRTLPTRQFARLDRPFRTRLEQQRRRALDRLRATDRALATLSGERRRIVAELDDLREQLTPPASWPRGRRPGRDRLADALPPLPEDPVWLWGRRLRAVCMRLLARCGPLPLRQLHALLHLHGFGVAGDHPVKVLADALGHEADQGHAVREGRGCYGPAPGYRPPRSPRAVLVDLPLPDLDE